MTNDLDQAWADVIAAEAAARTQSHRERHAPYRGFSDGYELVGLMGEAQFARENRQPLDLDHSGADAGWDFIVPLRFTLDVKTARRPTNLIQEQGKVVADIYVLAGFHDDPMRAELLGWELGAKLRRAPIRDFGYGVMSHFIPAAELRPMATLSARIMHLV